MKSFVLCGLLGILFCLTCEASNSHVCGHSAIDSVSFDWCIDHGDQAHNSDVLYNFGGTDAPASSWIDLPENQEIQNQWKTLNVPAPTIITISLGGEWLLTEIPHGSRPALYPWMVQKIMPFLERKLKGPVRHRLLKGVSMGGFNGSQLLLKDGGLFEKVALICPIIEPFGPLSPEADVERFIEKHRDFINRDWVLDLFQEFKDEFPTGQDYKNHNPLDLIVESPLKSKSVYLSCGDHDQYGFFEGTEQFAHLAMLGSAKVTWQPTHGGHCVVDSAKLAQFFAP